MSTLPSKESYKIGALRARFADEAMPWARAHVEGLIDQIEQLTQQRDEGWTNFYALRKQVAEAKYPGMTATVHAHETTAGDPDAAWKAEFEKVKHMHDPSCSMRRAVEINSVPTACNCGIPKRPPAAKAAEQQS